MREDEKKHFDNLREMANDTCLQFSQHTGCQSLRDCLFAIIGTVERIYGQFTQEDVDITKHDDHGRVKMENEE